MHSLDKTKMFAALWALALGAATCHQTQASVIMYEPFSGYTTGSIYGQTPNSLGLSTGTNWTKSGGGDSEFSVVTTGLTLGSGATTLDTTGGALVRTAPDGSSSNTVVHAVFNVSTFTGTLYTASLINFGDNSLAAANIAASNTTSTTGRRFYTSIRGAPVSGDWTGIPGVDLLGSAPTTAANAYSQANTTYLVLGRFTNVGTAMTAQNPGIGDMFILTAAQFDNFKAGGLTDAELDAAVIGAASNQVIARVTVTETSGTATFPLNGATTLSLQLFGNPNLDTDGVTYDEIRWGQSFDDVTPVTVPEPSTLALAAFGICCVGLARLRRRGR